MHNDYPESGYIQLIFCLIIVSKITAIIVTLNGMASTSKFSPLFQNKYMYMFLMKNNLKYALFWQHRHYLRHTKHRSKLRATKEMTKILIKKRKFSHEKTLIYQMSDNIWLYFILINIFLLRIIYIDLDNSITYLSKQI